MAKRFTKQARKQVNPIYRRQEKAIRSQIPATRQLYKTLSQGLDRDAQEETQNIVEDASARGVLRSTLPVDAQQDLGVALGEAKGKLSAQQASDIAGIRSQIGDLGLQRLGAIQSLADSLQQRSLMERQFQLQQKTARAAQAAANRQSSAMQALINKANSAGGGGNQALTSLPGIGLKDKKAGAKGGFTFKFGGTPVSAATWAEAQGADFGQLLKSMGDRGDTTAANAYLDIVRAGEVDENGNLRIPNDIKSKYWSLFWQPNQGGSSGGGGGGGINWSDPVNNQGWVNQKWSF